MMGRDRKIYEEAAALWRSLYGEPPPREADGTMILDQILGDLPESSYRRLTNPHLRPTNITFPKK